MMGTEDKTLLCLCHWGRKSKLLPDGSTSYERGITDQFIVKTGIQYNDFVNAVFDRLGIDPSDKIVHFTVKFDRSELIRLRDQEGVNTLFQFNDDFAHVYALSLEKDPNSRSPSECVKSVELIVDPEGVIDNENDLARPIKRSRADLSTGDGKFLQQPWAHQTAGKESVGGDGQKQAGVTMSCCNFMERLIQNGAGFLDRDVQNAGVIRSCSNSVGRLIQNGVDLHEGGVQNNNTGTVNEQASTPPHSGVEKIEPMVGSKLANVYDYPDPEFSDFDKHKAENCFAVNQIWACYDNVDGMPRFYAHIRKVSAPKFNILFSWLEANPEDRGDAAWVEAGLPVGCGKFKCGNTETTCDRLTFSHQVQCEIGMRGLYRIYPMKGETWALFKDWDIHWSSNLENHLNHEYEVVEILSDYVEDIGVQTGFLDKVSGFVSVFQRTRMTDVDTFFVKPTEIYKFSHRIPSFKMTGTEREDVPVGSFELDPASLPSNPDDVWYPEKCSRSVNTAMSVDLELKL